jgi:hypothetical protein
MVGAAQPMLLNRWGDSLIWNSTKIGNSQCTIVRWLVGIDVHFALSNGCLIALFRVMNRCGRQPPAAGVERAS